MNVAIIYGGVSCEHDVSIITAKQALENMDEKHKAVSIYNRDNKFYIPKSEDLKIYKNFEEKNFSECLIIGSSIFLWKMKKLQKFFDIDVCLLATHGGLGEDGSLQGFLEINGLPYISCDVASSAIAMDKTLQKKLFKQMNIPVIDYVEVDKREYGINSRKCLKKAESKLNYPMIVKPAKLGSSIGISFVKSLDELSRGLELAFMYDDKAVIEKALENIYECNCAAFACKENVFISCIEKPVRLQEFLSFEDKYLSGEGKGMSNLKRECPAKIPVETAKAIRRFTMEVYNELNLRGVVRIDYIIDENENIYINEINSIPGSLAYYLFEPQGIHFKDMINLLIEDCLYRKKQKKQLLLKYDSNILKIKPKYNNKINGK